MSQKQLKERARAEMQYLLNLVKNTAVNELLVVD
jgi:hypothetical protein